MPTHQYEPLTGPRGIRLLRLFGGSSAGLIAELVNTSLDSSIPFEALSYAWGSPEKPRSLELKGGAAIKITESLFCALLDLRYTSSARKPRVLWADALCINQEDEKEKCQQIPLMGEIYKSADRVITYIGEDTMDIESAILLAKKLILVSRLVEPKTSEKQRTAIEAKFGIPGKRNPAWACLRDFLARTWYTRMWIIQESVLNPKTIMVCGKVSFSWEIFTELSHLLETSSLMQYREVLPVTDRQVGALCYMARLRGFYHSDPGTSAGTNVLPLLASGRDFHCSDPRDHVFALSAIVRGQRIKPDYQKTVPRVFTEIALLLIRKYGFEVLSFAGLRRKPGVPSWVPDRSTAVEQIPVHKSRLFNAGGSMHGAILDIKEFSRTIRVSGIVFDRVCHVTKTLRRAFVIGRMGRYAWARNQLLRLTSRGTTCPGGGLYLEAFWRTLISDLDPNRRKEKHSALPSDANEFEAYVRPNKLWAKIEAIKTLLSYDPQENQNIPEIEPIVIKSCWEESRLIFDFSSDRYWAGKENVFSALRGNSKVGYEESRGIRFRDLITSAGNLYRTLITTEKGYIGLCLPEVEVGDVIVVVPGTAVPFILRPFTSGKYLLVCDCYCHGLMNGEALQTSMPRIEQIVLV